MPVNLQTDASLLQPKQQTGVSIGTALNEVASINRYVSALQAGQLRRSSDELAGQPEPPADASAGEGG